MPSGASAFPAMTSIVHQHINTTPTSAFSQLPLLAKPPDTMDRSNKPSAIGVGASLPQPTVSITDNTIEASLPSGESVTVYLYGATVTSWQANGQEQLFLSEKAHLDGSKPIRGGIPVVFPVRCSAADRLAHARKR